MGLILTSTGFPWFLMFFKLLVYENASAALGLISDVQVAIMIP